MRESKCGKGTMMGWVFCGVSDVNWRIGEVILMIQKEDVLFFQMGLFMRACENEIVDGNDKRRYYKDLCLIKILGSDGVLNTWKMEKNELKLEMDRK